MAHQRDATGHGLTAEQQAAAARWLVPGLLGPMDAADARGQSSRGCGDTVEISLRVEQGQVLRAVHCSVGCIGTLVAASVAADLARGREVAELLLITEEQLGRHAAGDLDRSRHGAALALAALRGAALDYLQLRAAPWKRLYRGTRRG